MEQEVTRKDQSWWKCPNCDENHSAKYWGCPYFQKSKEIQSIKYREKIPFYAARNVWKERERERSQRPPNTENFEETFPILPINTTVYSSTYYGTPGNTNQQNTTRTKDNAKYSNNQRARVNMKNAETQTSLTVSGMDAELVPKESVETAKNVAAVLIDFVDILTNTNEDPFEKKEKLVKSVTNKFGIKLTNADQNQENTLQSNKISNNIQELINHTKWFQHNKDPRKETSM